ncbi:polysaccharide pyruvyl transferase family protein [Polaribacter sp.]|nr:polysaccharide pyruvyl transferase family protein [Polaribacter sp.]
MKAVKKIGVLTLPYDANYGWILQHYALCKTIESADYEPISITRKWNKIENPGVLFKMKKWVFYNVLSKNIFNFYKDKIGKKTIVVDSHDKAIQLKNQNFKTVVVGSDQVWRTEYTIPLAGYNFFFDFINSKKTKKISYAASLGTDTWSEDSKSTKIISKLLKDFHKVSVREKSSVKVLKDILGIDANHNLDPTLLLDKKDYLSLIKSTNKLFKGKTIGTYILDYDENKSSIINYVRKTLDFNVYDIYPKNKSFLHYYIKVTKWLQVFRDSDFIITDSFHGTVFAIIFNKNFITISNKQRGLARFLSLLEIFDLSSRIVDPTVKTEDLKSILKNKIDYSKVNEILTTERNKSLIFLKENI